MCDIDLKFCLEIRKTEKKSTIQQSNLYCISTTADCSANKPSCHDSFKLSTSITAWFTLQE